MSRSYRIWAPRYRNWSNGIRCLHRLAFLLRERGFEATINEEPKNPDYIAVYPETVPEVNLWNAPKFVRYILHRPGVVAGPTSHPKDTIKIWFDKILAEPGNQDLALEIHSIELEYFNADGAGPRDTTCGWIGRAARKGYINGRPSGKTIITHKNPSTRKGVADLFRRSRIFYTYEPLTAMITEAGLCGCPTLIMTDWRKYPIPLKELKRRGWNPPGVGIGADGLKQALKTLPMVLPDYLMHIGRTEKQLDAFIEMTQNL